VRIIIFSAKGQVAEKKIKKADSSVAVVSNRKAAEF